MHQMKIFLALTLVFGLFTGGAQAVSLEETVRKSITVKDHTLLSLENRNGNIEIEAWDHDVVEIEAYKKVRAGTKEKAERLLEEVQIIFNDDGDEISVETVFPRNDGGKGGFFSWIFNGGEHGISVAYKVRVPKKFDLNIHSTNGKIQLAGGEGRFRLETTNGAIDGEDVAGVARCSTTNGSIRFSFDKVTDGEEMRFYSTNGSVKLYLPGNIDADLRAKTTNGSIRCDLPVTHHSSSSNRLSGIINGGGPEISIKTTNGSIRIYESG